MSISERLYSLLLKRSPQAAAKMPAEVQQNIAPNGLCIVSAQALQSSGDQTVNASTVLPWLFAALGVPAALTGLLVPIRESLSMLPQAMLTPLILRIKYRKHVFIVGAVVQALAVTVMIATAALGQGLPAGVAIVVALAVFALGRCLCSIASKDVMGRTIPKGERGQINGLSTTVAGFVALTLGVGIRFFGGTELDATGLIWLLAIGAGCWVGVALIYVAVREPAGEVEKNTDPNPDSSTNTPHRSQNWFTQTKDLLASDRQFRHFVLVRSLLLVSSLSPPFIVTLSIAHHADGLTGLGGFIIASGVAALIGGRIFGPMADKSSKRLMSLGAGIASTIVVLVVILTALPMFTGAGLWGELLFVGTYFALTLMQNGVRVGRKTYVVDMAEGDTRTKYVAVSNSAMGLILLIVGGISSALAVIHVYWALLFLAAMGFVGVFAGAKLPDVSQN